MRKFLTITFIALLILIGMSINVHAAEVTTLDELVNELANGTDKEVTLNGDVAITNTKTLNLNGKTLKLNKSLVVDGGDLTITGNGTISTDVVSPLIRVNTGSKLVLENGTYSSTKSAGVAVRIVGSTLTEDAPETIVTVKENAKISANYGVFIAQNSKAAYGVEVNIHGTIEGITGNNGYNQGSMAVTTNGYIKEPATNSADVAEINIYETAKLTAAEGASNNMNSDDAPAIYGAGYAIWNIYGGHLEGSEALSIKGGEFYVYGGTLKATGKFNSDPTAYNNGSEATGSAISITENKSYAGNIILEVYDAIVTSKNGYAVFETITAKAVQPAVNSLIIAGGNYSGAEGDVKAETLTKFIESGTFKTEPKKDYLVEDVTAEKDSDGNYVVGTRYNVAIKETANGKVTASVEKALEGEKVKLIATAVTGYEFSKWEVLNADNKEVKVVDGTFIMPAGGVTVIAEFTKIIPPMDYVITGNETENNNIGVVETEKTVETLDASLKADTELNKKVEEERQKGNQVTIEIAMEELEKDAVKKEEKEKILQTVAANQKVHQYFDISVLVKTNETELGKITQLTETMKFSMEISKDLIQEGRRFYIIKLHGDEVKRIDAELVGTKLEFEIDQFSTFALAYEDEVEEDETKVETPTTEKKDDDAKVDVPTTEEKDDTPKTGAINIVTYIWIALVVIALVGIVTTKKPSKHSK